MVCRIGTDEQPYQSSLRPPRRSLRGARSDAGEARRARSGTRPAPWAGRSERTTAPLHPPAAADAVRKALGEARPRPAGARARGSRAGGGGSGRRSGEGGSAAAPGARPRAAAESRRPARTPAADRGGDRASVCPCCSGAMHVIGEDRSERLDVIPMRYQVVVTRRPKYGCRACQSAVEQAPAPPRLVEGGLPTERMVAQVLVTKYADHAPLYRQAQMLARQDIVIDRSTLASWVGTAAAELKPRWRLLREELLGSARLFVDETTAPVLDPGRGRTKTGYFWAIARDDRPWGGTDPPAVVYSYAPGRGNEHAAKLLKNFRGILQADAYVVYKKVAESPGTDGAAEDGVMLAHCWAHCRRRFFEIAHKRPAPIAREALQRIAALYEIEAEIRGRSADERWAARQLRTKPPTR